MSDSTSRTYTVPDYKNIYFGYQHREANEREEETRLVTDTSIARKEVIKSIYPKSNYERIL